MFHVVVGFLLNMKRNDSRAIKNMMSRLGLSTGMESLATPTRCPQAISQLANAQTKVLRWRLMFRVVLGFLLRMKGCDSRAIKSLVSHLGLSTGVKS